MHSVLVIEDDPHLLTAWLLLLETWGYAADGARSIAEAVRAAERSAPTVMLVDYRLRGGETGPMAVTEVRRRIAKAIPAIVVTGETAPDRLRELAAGELPVLHKPVAPAQMLPLVAALCDAGLGTA